MYVNVRQTDISYQPQWTQTQILISTPDINMFFHSDDRRCKSRQCSSWFRVPRCLQCAESRDIISIERRLCMVSWSSSELRRFIVLWVQHCRTHMCQSAESTMTLITILIWTLACCCFTGSFTQQHFKHHVLSFLSFLSADKSMICFCVQDAAVRLWLWLSLQSRRLPQDPPSLSPVQPAQMFTDIIVMIIHPGINRNLDSLQSSW